MASERDVPSSIVTSGNSFLNSLQTSLETTVIMSSLSSLNLSYIPPRSKRITSNLLRYCSKEGACESFRPLKRLRESQLRE